MMGVEVAAEKEPGPNKKAAQKIIACMIADGFPFPLTMGEESFYPKLLEYIEFLRARAKKDPIK